MCDETEFTAHGDTSHLFFLALARMARTDALSQSVFSSFK